MPVQFIPAVPAAAAAAVHVGLVDTLLRPFELAISQILLTAHSLLVTAGLPAVSGFTWAASIAVLVVVVRAALLPLVIRQVRSSHRLAAAVPRLQEIKERYRNVRDRESLARLRAETRAVYADTGARPLGFLPMLVQVPILLALFRVLDAAAHGRPAGAVAATLAMHLGNATVAGASFGDRLGAGGAASVVVVGLTAVMVGALWLLQHRQVTMNTAPAALDGTAGVAQRMSVWLLPSMAVFSGLAFPIGVLVYFACTNLWSLGQQAMLARWLPTPGSPAHTRKLAREMREATVEGPTGRR
jgi:YidC/Oxa1 family membrane protein insertase